MQYAVIARLRLMVACLAFAIVTTGAANAQHGFQPGTLQIDVGQYLASAFGWVKDAHVRGVLGRNEPRSGHENWCRSQQRACPGEFRRFLNVLERDGPRQNVQRRCYIAANLQAAREQLTRRISGPRDGHYNWCMNNQRSATAFLREEIHLLRQLVR